VAAASDEKKTTDEDETLDGLEGCIAPVATVVMTLLLIALTIASWKLLGFDLPGIVLTAVVVLWIAIAWWRLRRKPQS
jgi:hypothetical protein